MRFFGLDDSPKIQVTGNISAAAYKKLCEALKPLSKEELWKVLDHYIFHCMSDADVDSLVVGLQDMQKSGVPLTASAALSLIEDEEHRYLVKDVPTLEELEQSKTFWTFLFDQTYFESYTPPYLRAPTAKVLISFVQEKGLPQMDLWSAYLAPEEDA
jgi:hypothetical protein